MENSSATRTIAPEAIHAAEHAYRPLVEKALTKQHDQRFREYLATIIANNASLQRHLRAFEIYAPYLKSTDVILDWGCRHSPDSCFIRSLLPGAELHGCDTPRASEGVFEDFFAYSRLNYKQLDHVFELPYEDCTFDVLISSGVFEHVACETESLREIWRVLKRGGLFILTFLPNRYSVSEQAARLLKTNRGQNRLYSRRDIRERLLRSGFLPQASGYHQLIPTFAKGLRDSRLASIGDFLLPLNDMLDGVYPFAVVSSNIFVIAKKVAQM